MIKESSPLRSGETQFNDETRNYLVQQRERRNFDVIEKISIKKVLNDATISDADRL